MLGRLFKTAPTLAVALLVGGCGTFASDPPRANIASDAAAGSLKDSWVSNVVPVAATQVYAAPSGKPSAPFAPAQAEAAATCVSDRDCVVILAALIKDPK